MPPAREDSQFAKGLLTELATLGHKAAIESTKDMGQALDGACLREISMSQVGGLFLPAR